MRQRMIFVVATDYNGWQQTRICLERLRASSFRDFTVLLVDHGTTDETRAGLATSFPEVVRLSASPQLWWAGATNVGIREALGRGADFVVLLNNDCYVTAETLSALVAHAGDARAPAIIAPLQRNLRDGELRANRMTSCFWLGFPTLQLPWPADVKPGEHRLLAARLIPGGRGVLIPASVFRQVGLLDEEALPHYYADHDFYLRCRRVGIPLYLALDAFVDIDNARTTAGDRPESMSWRQFRSSLVERRSHRNTRDISVLFRRHSPIPGVHYLGVLLHMLRFTLLYVAGRVANLAGRRR
jgi:GT2 family glycosyltransferase